MQTIGERLLEARQRRGVSIRDAAESTKVRGDYLAAMESNQFDSIPLSDVYRRGFLKIYGRFLRLDADRLVGDYNAILAARSPSGTRVRRGSDVESSPRGIDSHDVDSRDDFSSGAIEVASRPQDNRRKFQMIGAGVGALVVVLLLVGFWPSSAETAGSAASSTVVTAPAALQLGSSHSAPIRVRILRDNKDGPELFSAEISPGAEVAVPGVTGKVLIVATPLDKLVLRINGALLNSFPPGYSSGNLNIPAPTGR